MDFLEHKVLKIIFIHVNGTTTHIYVSVQYNITYVTVNNISNILMLG